MKTVLLQIYGPIRHQRMVTRSNAFLKTMRAANVLETFWFYNFVSILKKQNNSFFAYCVNAHQYPLQSVIVFQLSFMHHLWMNNILEVATWPVSSIKNHLISLVHVQALLIDAIASFDSHIGDESTQHLCVSFKELNHTYTHTSKTFH